MKISYFHFVNFWKTPSTDERKMHILPLTKPTNRSQGGIWGVAMDYAASLVKRFSFLSIYGGVTLFSLFLVAFQMDFPTPSFDCILQRLSHCKTTCTNLQFFRQKETPYVGWFNVVQVSVSKRSLPSDSGRRPKEKSPQWTNYLCQEQGRKYPQNPSHTC